MKDWSNTTIGAIEITEPTETDWALKNFWHFAFDLRKLYIYLQDN